MSVLPPPEKLAKDHLRHLEKDVLIPKKLKAVAMQICSEYVEGCSTLLLNIFVNKEISVSTLASSL